MASTTPAYKDKTLLYIFDHADWKSRMPIATAARDLGFKVIIGIIGEPDDTGALERFESIILPKPEGKFSPKAVLGTLKNLRQTITKTKPDITHTITLKYSFLLGLASFGTPKHHKIYTLAGLGFLFRSEGLKPFLMRVALSPLLYFVFRDKAAQLIFQNPDDLELFTSFHYAPKCHCHLVISSGTDLDKFKPIKDHKNNKITVLMPTRLVKEKGVHIFVDAAKKLKANGIDAEFQIAGGETKHNPSAISREEMHELTKDGNVTWLGRIDNMPKCLSESDIVVYPSYYGEGVPRVMIEAAACGKPIITTDHPGCRETVEDGENGFLVPIKNTDATAHAIEKLIKNDKLRLKMGQNSRKLAETIFDINKIVKKTVSIYQKLEF